MAGFIEEQYQKYLKIGGLSEATMGELQKQETKRAFYGGFGVMMVYVASGFDNAPDDKVDSIYASLMAEMDVFWSAETAKYNARIEAAAKKYGVSFHPPSEEDKQ